MSARRGHSALDVKAVLFDLFDTLVIFDQSRLPTITVNGREVRSTAAYLHAVLREHVACDVTLERCYDALRASWQEAERRRALDHREVTAQERFGDWLGRLSIAAAACPDGFVTTLAETHRRELTKAAHFPPHHVQLLESLARRYRLAVVSNFDYTPTAVGLIEAAGVAHLFDTIVVSDVVGWRKPRRDIFDVALSELGIDALDALFVGDRADIDVAGAQALGMPVAWINRDAEPLPAGIAPPDFELRDLAELGPILRVASPGPPAAS